MFWNGRLTYPGLQLKKTDAEVILLVGIIGYFTPSPLNEIEHDSGD